LGRVELPAALRAFIERHLTSAVQVEVLLLLHRERQGWNATTVAKELRIYADHSQELLTRLTKIGLLQEDAGTYHYAPRTADLAARVDALAELYPSFRVAITSLIYAKASRSMRDFSDAFRLRDED
jgi:hypothetical protein